jgi:hypothetical protein
MTNKFGHSLTTSCIPYSDYALWPTASYQTACRGQGINTAFISGILIFSNIYLEDFTSAIEIP